MHPLDDPRNKMRRAREHLEELSRETASYRATDTYSISREVSADGILAVYRITPTAIPGPRIGTIVGDIVHNMRSALDHMVWQLALLKSSRPYRFTAFPVFKDETEEHSKRICSVLRDVPEEAADLIKRLQPYHAGNEPENSPLWILHALWNTDKHSTLLPMAHVGWMPAYFGPGGSQKALDDGTIETTVPLEVDEQMNLNERVSANVAFPLDSPGRGMEVVELLEMIYKALDELIFPALSAFFPEEEAPRRLRVDLLRQDVPPGGV